MPGTYQYDVEIKSNVAKLLSDMKQVQDRLDTVEGKEYKIKLNVDEKKLSSVISNLEKMLDSLGKGTGDFKQFENLSKELSNIVSEVQSLSKSFGKVDDSGTKTLLSSIQNIDKSLSELSQNILNVNKNMSNMGGNTSGAVKQVENISNAYQDAAKEAEKLADAQSKIGQKTNISSGNSFQINVAPTSITSADAIQKENDALEATAQKATEAATSKEKFSEANQQVKESADESVSSIKDEADAFSQAEWDKNVQAIQDYMDAVTKLNNLKAKDKDTGKDVTNISRQEQEVEKLKEAAYEARAALTSMINPHDVDIDTWKDWVNAMKQFDQASLGSAESVAKLEDALRNASDARKNYINSVKDKHTGYSNDYQNALSKDGYLPTNAFKEKVAKYQALCNKLIESADDLSQKDIVSQEQLDSFEELKRKCEDARQELTKMSASDKGAWAVDVQKEISKITKELHENSNFSDEAKQKLQAFIDQLNAGDISDTTLKKIHEEFLRITNAEKAAGREGKNFIDILKNSGIHKIAADLVGMFSVYDLINAGKQGVSIVRELNTALTEMRKVSDETVQSLKDYQATTFDTADAVGTTAKQIQNSTADWMRLGESMNQAAKSAKTANVLLNVSEFDNIEDATKSLVAMGQAYKDLDKMTIVDKLNEVGKIVAQTYSNVWCYKNIAW